VVFLISLATSLLLYLLLAAIVKCHYFSVFFIAFVFRPFLFLHITGALNMFINPNFYIKIVLMILAMMFDRFLTAIETDSYSIPVFPSKGGMGIENSA
jgi:hypothetical protein